MFVHFSFLVNCKWKRIWRNGTSSHNSIWGTKLCSSIKFYAILAVEFFECYNWVSYSFNSLAVYPTLLNSLTHFFFSYQMMQPWPKHSSNSSLSSEKKPRMTSHLSKLKPIFVFIIGANFLSWFIVSGNKESEVSILDTIKHMISKTIISYCARIDKALIFTYSLIWFIEWWKKCLP